MNNLSEVVVWTEEYMSLVDAEFSHLLPVQRKILERSKDLIMNNAAAHLAQLAPFEFISMLPESERYFFPNHESWWTQFI